jgi:hypothetical protein
MALNSAASGSWPGGAAPVIAGVALLSLAGCTSYQPLPHDPAWSGGYSGAIVPSSSYTRPPSYPSPPRYYQLPPDPQPAPPPSGGSWLIPRADAAEPPPLRPVPPPELHPVDQSCGWWRLCNFWSGSW